MRLDDGWQILYPNLEDRCFDVIETKFSFGHDKDLMEAYGYGMEDVEVVDVEQALELFKKFHSELKMDYCFVENM